MAWHKLIYLHKDYYLQLGRKGMDSPAMSMAHGFWWVQQLVQMCQQQRLTAKKLVVLLLLQNIECLRELALSQGINIQISSARFELIDVRH